MFPLRPLPRASSPRPGPPSPSHRESTGEIWLRLQSGICRTRKRSRRSPAASFGNEWNCRASAIASPISPQQHLQNDEPRAHHDGAIRQIEGVPMIIAEVKTKKVLHDAGAHAVKQVGERPAQHQRRGQGRLPNAGSGVFATSQTTTTSRTMEMTTSSGDLPPDRRIRENSEHRPGILGVGQVEKARDDRNHSASGQRGAPPGPWSPGRPQRWPQRERPSKFWILDFGFWTPLAIGSSVH